MMGSPSSMDLLMNASEIGWRSAVTLVELENLFRVPGWSDLDSLGACLLSLVTASAQLAPDQPTLELLRGLGCEDSSRLVSTWLGRRGFDAKILEGEARLEADHWLQHAVSMVRSGERRVTVDFTAHQFSRFASAPFLVVAASDHRTLGEALVANYDWWLE
jgi:hypothetical protein